MAGDHENLKAAFDAAAKATDDEQKELKSALQAASVYIDSNPADLFGALLAAGETAKAGIIQQALKAGYKAKTLADALAEAKDYCLSQIDENEELREAAEAFDKARLAVCNPNNIGRFGAGVALDASIEKAVKYFSKLARNGNVPGQENTDIVNRVPVDL